MPQVSHAAAHARTGVEIPAKLIAPAPRRVSKPRRQHTRPINDSETFEAKLTYSYSASAGANGVGTSAGNSEQLVSIDGTINSGSRSQTFTYDTFRRLATASGWSASGRRWAYDRWGNRTGMWDAISGGNQLQNILIATTSSVANNRIANVNGVTYTYDASGNCTNDGAHSYTYDGEDRQVSVDSGATSTSAYDSNNRRVKKVAGGVTTHCVWEGAQVIAEYNGSNGALISEYIFAGSRMVARDQSGVLKYYHQDRLSTRLITDSSGTVIGTSDHLPFGEAAGTTGDTEKHRFTTYERDSESGTDHAINRQQQFANGRFMQPDAIGGSIGEPQSLNRYAYVADDPVNLADPLGLCGFNISITANNLLSANQLNAMRSEISRIYETAGQQINFVSNNANYWLNVNAKGDPYRANYKNLPDNAVGVTGRDGGLVGNTGRVFVDRLTASASSSASFGQNSKNLAIGLGRAGAHEIGHFLLQQAFDSGSIQGTMHAGFHGEQWFGKSSENLWTFNAYQIWRLNQLCKPITPENAPLKYQPIGPQIIGGGRVGGGFGGGGFGGSPFGNWNIFDLLQLLTAYTRIYLVD